MEYLYVNEWNHYIICDTKTTLTENLNHINTTISLNKYK